MLKTKGILHRDNKTQTEVNAKEAAAEHAQGELSEVRPVYWQPTKNISEDRQVSMSSATEHR